MVISARLRERLATAQESATETSGFLATLWHASPRLATAALIMVPTATALTAASTYLSGTVIDAVTARLPWSSVVMLLVGLIITMALAPVVESAVGAVGSALDVRLLRRQHRRLAEASLGPQGIAHLEDPQQASRLANLVENVRDWRSLAAAQSTIAVFGARIGGVAALLLIAVVWVWWVPLVIAITEFWLGAIFRRYIAGLMAYFAPPAGSPRRRIAYLAGLLTGPGAAREVRLFGLTGWVLDRWRVWWARALDDPGQRRALHRGLVWSPALLAVYLGAFALLVGELAAGALSPGDALVVLQAIGGLSVFGMLGDQQSAMVFAVTTDRDLERARSALDIPRAPDDHDRGEARPAAASGPAACVFDAVEFSYPGAPHPVLRDFTLRIEPGQTVAVVGPNGAGKSTLIKLLTGLYAPDRGRVSVAGRRTDPADGVVSVIFQDFARYPLDLRDNVDLGAAAETRAGDSEQTDRPVVQALHDAGAESLLQRHSLATMLAPEFEGGTDLSGGQWQRVALARALASIDRGASVLVLDEPTSALDIRAEADLFDRFAAHTADVTTILVTHRLSSVRSADRIVVVDGGRVCEDGTHDALMELGGTYAAMFATQAARFSRRRPGVGDDTTDQLPCDQDEVH